MKKKIFLYPFYIVIVTGIITGILLFCSEPVNPFQNINNVTIDFLVPDSTDTIQYTKDTVAITLLLTSTREIDSIKVTIGNYDTAFSTIPDTVTLTWVFNDTGSIFLNAVAYCTKGLDRECHRSVHVLKNPLVPPDSIYTQVLSDTSIHLFWESVPVAVTYQVYRGVSDTGSFSLITSVPDTFFSDTVLLPSTTYFYKVSTIDSLNRESEQSSPFSATTMDKLPSRWDVMIWDEDTWE